MHRLRSARANTCARHTRLRTIILSRFRCHAEGTRRTERSERGADNSELRTRQSHLLAEVLHLISGSRLHCALNHAQIKKLVIFKINGGRGQPLAGRILSPADFVTPAQLPSSLPPSMVSPTLSAHLHPHRRLGGAALARQSDALTVFPPSFIQHFIICCYCSVLS